MMNITKESSLEKTIWFGSEKGPGDPGEGVSAKWVLPGW